MEFESGARADLKSDNAGKTLAQAVRSEARERAWRVNRKSIVNEKRSLGAVKELSRLRSSGHASFLVATTSTTLPGRRGSAHTEEVQGITGVERAELARGKSEFIEDLGFYVVEQGAPQDAGEPQAGEALQARIDHILSTLPQKVVGQVKWPKDMPLSEGAPAQGDMIRRLQIDRVKNHGPMLDKAFQTMWDIAESSGAEGAIAYMEETVSRNRLMQHLYIRAFVLLILHNPAFHEKELYMPELEKCVIFHRWNTLATAQETLTWKPPAIPSDDTLTYFRDDYAFSQHHFLAHHVFYHQGIPTGSGRRTTIERQGELFFYKHQQMLTRYVAERIAWGLPPLTPYFGLPGQTYPEHDHGFMPPATLRLANEFWPFPFVCRPAKESPEGLKDGTDFDMTVMQKQVDAFWAMIESGELPDGRPLTLDMMGRMMEQHITGLEFPDVTGLEGVHNAMHDMWSMVGQGPDTTNYGCMGQGLDSARDSIFYHVHTYIDSMREQFLAKHVDPHRLPDKHCPIDLELCDFAVNATIHTTLSPGKHMHERGHLDHSPFEWSFTVKSDAVDRELTARIFMVPAEAYADHTRWMEMDKFTIRMEQQQQHWTRKCSESSAMRLPGDHCSCGWPYNLMVPAGRPEGMGFVCALILTQNDRDTSPCGCSKGSDPIIECASKSGGVYPDKLAMGYPFDRKIESATGHSEDLLEQLASLANCQICRCSVKLEIRC